MHGNAIDITGVKLEVNVVEKPADGRYEKGVLNLIDLDNINMDEFAFGKVSGMCGKAAYEYIAKALSWQMQEK